MKPADRARIVAELSWLHEEPERVADLLTEAEARQILKQGFVCGHLWADIKARLKHKERA